MLLARADGPILGPISTLLGALFNFIYDVLDKIGLKVGIIGVSIILFTIVIRLILFPLIFKQNKSSKITNHIQPEINKITKKYRGRKDQQSMLMQQQEVRELQAKYGVSMTSGCLSSLLQLPIFFALYNVIQNIPSYVGKVFDLYKPIADRIAGNAPAMDALEEVTKGSTTPFKADGSTIDTIVDALSTFKEGTWDKFIELVSSNVKLVDTINAQMDPINDAYAFLFGINLSHVPGFALTATLLIPIMSMVFQYLSVHATPQQGSNDPQQEQTMKSMKMFMNIMPIMSFFVCINVPAGVGLYWAMGSLVSFFTSIGVNFYFKHCDMDKIVDKSKAKATKKAAKRKAKGKKTFMERMQEAAGEQASQAPSPGRGKNVGNTSLKNYTSSTSTNSNTNYKPGSLASKANAMQRYNNNGGKK